MTDKNEVVKTKSVIPGVKDEILSNSFDIESFLQNNPPLIEWIIPDLIPCDITAMLTGKGGSGKTFWLLDLMISISCGASFLNKKEWTPKKPSKVLCIFGEETKEIIHRRLKKIIKFKNLNNQQLKLLPENIFIYSSHGKNPALMSSGSESDFYKNLIGKIEEIEPTLVIFDPIARFYKEDENDNTKATIFIEKLEKLKTHQTLNEKRKTSILIAHHTNKGILNNQTSSRGASAFVDGVRWQCLLSRIETNLAGETISAQDRNLISMTIPKSNHLKYGANDIVLRVLDDAKDNNCGGVLSECDQLEEETLTSGNTAGYHSKVSEQQNKKRSVRKQKVY